MVVWPADVEDRYRVREYEKDLTLFNKSSLDISFLQSFFAGNYLLGAAVDSVRHVSHTMVSTVVQIKMADG